MELFGTKVLDSPTDKKVIQLQTFIDFNQLFGVVRCLKTVYDIDSLAWQIFRFC